MGHYDVHIMIKFTPDYEASGPTFWRVLKELANENTGLVAYDKLQVADISWKLDARGSVLMLEHMEKPGKIKKTENDPQTIICIFKTYFWIFLGL